LLLRDLLATDEYGTEMVEKELLHRIFVDDPDLEDEVWTLLAS